MDEPAAMLAMIGMGRRSMGVMGPALLALGMVAWALPSWVIAKKVIALLVLPAGALWLGLLALACWPGLRRWPRLLAIALFCGYSVAGNAWTGGWLLGRLEAPYVHSAQEVVEPLDVLFVLGGGTAVTPAGEPQLGPAGDRLIVPARWYFAGKARHLVTSGLSVSDVNGQRSLADDTAAMWKELGIPESAVTRLSSPRTTAEEIVEIKGLMARNAWKRAGVCSSAWHLPRVERLCRKEGVVLIPVPADFQSGELAFTPLYAVPQARGFQNVQKALWELLGAWLG